MASIGEAVLVEKWFDSEGEVSKGWRISFCDHIPIPFLWVSVSNAPSFKATDGESEVAREG